MDHGQSLNKTAASATLHCLTGCAIGEVLGMIIATWLGWSAFGSVVLAISLAFLFGYALSIKPLLKHGIDIKRAAKVAFIADTSSITIMEIVDNAFILLIPGAIHAELNSWLFWISLFASLAVAYVAAFPLNRYLISKGRGHAYAHQFHYH